MNKLILTGVIVLIILTGFGIYKAPTTSLGGGSMSNCHTTTSSVATVGDDISSTLLAANGRRAWARIQQPASATNTLSVAFNNGTAAVKNTGTVLTYASGVASSTVDSIEFGLNTDFPYTGIVTGITSVGSTTVLITECSY